MSDDGFALQNFLSPMSLILFLSSFLFVSFVDVKHHVQVKCQFNKWFCWKNFLIFINRNKIEFSFRSWLFYWIREKRHETDSSELKKLNFSNWNAMKTIKKSLIRILREKNPYQTPDHETINRVISKCCANLKETI